ncbi:MAG: log [Acidimicrobiales bacterium]|jgi:uncharacterized protein (TIGR00730 family)|nr:log [Acidimicrobiales bacterium]
MTDPLPRYRTGDADLDARLVALLDAIGATENRDQLFEILVSVAKLGQDHTDRLNLKITNAALNEMENAFRVFAPLRGIPKVTIFGSARTLPTDPLYPQARELAAAIAARGWMVVTGAGPGIMEAASEGAGLEHTIGVNIRLPFEQDANPYIADPRLVTMKYFFTRKLMLMKESAGFAVLPGGVGTLDETFELLTLVQTGKAAPAPIVLVDVPHGTYWQAWNDFMMGTVADGGLISRDDCHLYRITDSVDDAVAEIIGFYRNYHSMRYVGNVLVLRLRAQPTPEEVARLNEEFGDICVSGGIEVAGPRPAEVRTRDHVGLPRLALRFDRMSHGRLRALIDAINALDSAPPIAGPEIDRDAFESAGSPMEDVEVMDDSDS